MKLYTKPSMTIAKFGSKEDIANGSAFYELLPETEAATGEYGTVSVYQITSLGASSN